jgi:hypothetical protein
VQIQLSERERYEPGRPRVFSQSIAVRPLTGFCAKTREGTAMLFMVIERFRDQNAKAIYARYRERGRLMSDGIGFVGSWVAADLGRCFQVMECDDLTLLQHWAAEWSDLIEFEIIPVAQGKDTSAALAA